MSTSRALWVCLGLTSVLARTGKATHRASIDTMLAAVDERFFREAEVGLAVLTAFELCRLTETNETWAIDIVTKRKLVPGELSGVASDIFRITRLSEPVRKALAERGVGWLAVADDRFRSLANGVQLEKLQFMVP